MYLNVEGVAPTPALGVEWVRKAAMQGMTAAMGRLGDAYAVGEGVGRDPVEAIAWFTLCVLRADGEERDACAVGRSAVSNALSAAQRGQAEQRAAALLPSLKPR